MTTEPPTAQRDVLTATTQPTVPTSEAHTPVISVSSARDSTIIIQNDTLSPQLETENITHESTATVEEKSTQESTSDVISTMTELQTVEDKTTEELAKFRIQSTIKEQYLPTLDTTKDGTNLPETISTDREKQLTDDVLSYEHTNAYSHVESTLSDFNSKASPLEIYTSSTRKRPEQLTSNIIPPSQLSGDAPGGAYIGLFMWFIVLGFLLGLILLDINKLVNHCKMAGRNVISNFSWKKQR